MKFSWRMQIVMEVRYLSSGRDGVGGSGGGGSTGGSSTDANSASADEFRFNLECNSSMPLQLLVQSLLHSSQLHFQILHHYSPHLQCLRHLSPFTVSILTALNVAVMLS